MLCFCKQFIGACFRYLETSLAKKDSAINSSTESHEAQQQITEKDKQIEAFRIEIEQKNQQIKDLVSRQAE